MAFRRSTKAPPRRRFKRRAPLRTTGVKETRWNTSRWVVTREFNFNTEFEFASNANVDMVVLNPRVMFEMTLQPTTPIGGPVTNIAPIINTLQALRGVKVGGIVWNSGFHCANIITDAAGELFVNAYSQCIETLWTREVDDVGIVTGDVPPMHATWRPLRVDDSVFDPVENAGDLVRIHHTRYAPIAVGDNAFGWGIDNDAPAITLGSASAAASTWTQPGWGGGRSIRLRKFIADEQSLNFNLFVHNPNPSATNQMIVVWTCMATVYWAMQNQR